MLPRKRRIPKAFFEESFANKGFFVNSGFFSLKVIPLSGEAKFACVVSKKIGRTAVSRNKLRRKFYRILSKMPPESLTGFFGIFYPKAEAAKASEVSLSGEIGTALKKAAGSSS